MAPAAAEMLEALGVGDRVVCIGDFVPAPEGVDLPRIGAYDAPNVERILELEADLYVSAASEAALAAHHKLEALGVEVLALDTSTYAGVFQSFGELARETGRTDSATALSARIRQDMAEIRERAAGLAPRRVLFVVGRDPLFVAGPGSHIDEMIALVSATNVFHDGGSPYERVSMEVALQRMPEVIIDTSDNSAEAQHGRIAREWARFGFLPAVRENRVWHVDPSQLVIPGIRLAEMSRLMARLVHPEVFGEPAPPELGPRAEHRAR
jgi:iron complex transport system substrate-binding protein